MKFEAPQIIQTVLMAMGLGISIAKMEDVAVAFVSVVITVTLLWWGGFYG